MSAEPDASTLGHVALLSIQGDWRMEALGKKKRL